MLLATLALSCGGSQAGKTTEPTPQAAASPIPWKTIEPPTQVGVAGATPRAQQPSAARTYSGVGVVRLVNLKEGWLEIDHEEIKGLMPAMQMEWSVRDRTMLESVRVGDKVNFTIEDDNGTEVITELKRAAATP
jgi:Cu/Ag efflux protein CusF